MIRLRGRIIKGIGGFYYVKVEDTIYECRASGLFRLDEMTPTVGDYVHIEINDDGTGYIKEIEERKNLFLRPSVSNVDEVYIVVSVVEPDANKWLIDKMILLSRFNGINPNLIVTKSDLDGAGALELEESYTKAGFDVFSCSIVDKKSYDLLHDRLLEKTVCFMGVSGSGKSTLISELTGLDLEVGEVSLKTSRGKHTTRHVELIEYDKDTYLFDTPGFSSLDLVFISDVYSLESLYYEFHDKGACKFRDCLHLKEPGCVIKDAVNKGDIQKFRYDNYIYFLNEINDRR